MSLRILILERSYPSLRTETKFLIWSFEHNAWWGPNSLGYVRSSDEAGIYGCEEAAAICAKANLKMFINEAMVPATVDSVGKEIAR